ncbi:MAG: formimidoylglutamate deiminase [Neomegalonema sp.]
MSKAIWAERALTSNGWRRNTLVSLDDAGRIRSVEEDATPSGMRVGVLLPAPANLHSHAFQRAMAGMTEGRGPSASDSFWTWRDLMYRFVGALEPDDVEAIAAWVQVEMLEAGYASVGEFHYLHHQPNGDPYDDVAELSSRIAVAAEQTGIGLTLLPVLYERGGCDGRALAGGQLRFGNDADRFEILCEGANRACANLPRDTVVGVAPHSLRAGSRSALTAALGIAPTSPVHLHIAEQTAEVEEVEAAYGARPVAWLLNETPVDARWCLIHATHMSAEETFGVTRSGAVAGLCPITESNLGDGIFDGVRFLTHGGRFGVGSDSNVRISLCEELRTLEYSQRLRDRSRAALATADRSSGRILFEGAACGGAQALGRDAGEIAPGKLADLVALDAQALDLIGLEGDALLDAWIFARDDGLVRDVWSAGRHVVTDGRHFARDRALKRFRQTLRSLRERV